MESNESQQVNKQPNSDAKNQTNIQQLIPPRVHDVSVVRLSKKLEKVKVQQAVNWDKSRAFTPNSSLFFKREKSAKLLVLDENDNTTHALHQSETQNSQGLVRANNRTIGGSVTSSIHTITNRNSEKKKTYIQYDKDRVDMVGKDFNFRPFYYRGQSSRKYVKYQGGHVIDHKYSAGNSHIDEMNYVPMHYFYNAPLKEYLVQRSDDYIEILLYTPSPPRIGVKGKKRENKYHDIPVGIIFVQICNRKIQDAYFFPNNDYDYKALSSALNATEDLAATIAPYFKLKKAFHRLLMPACVVDINENEKRVGEQLAYENQMLKIVDDISHGMSLAECSEEEEQISKISFDVIQKHAVDIQDYLESGQEGLDLIKQNTLALPFNELGRFFVQYALKNALKSEVVSITSRLIFVGVVVDFIEAYYEVDEEALDIVEADMAESFKCTLRELDKIKDTMSKEELLYFANLYERLSKHSSHDFSMQGYPKLYAFEDIFQYTKNFVGVLKILSEKIGQESSQSGLLNLIELFVSAQVAISYLFIYKFPEDELSEECKFLRSIKPRIKECMVLHQSSNNLVSVNEAYQSSVTGVTHVKTSYGAMEAEIEYLGSKSSMFYSNSSSEDDNESEDESLDKQDEIRDQSPQIHISTQTKSWEYAKNMSQSQSKDVGENEKTNYLLSQLKALLQKYTQLKTADVSYIEEVNGFMSSMGKYENPEEILKLHISKIQIFMDGNSLYKNEPVFAGFVKK